MIIGCKKQVEAALADQKKVADVEVSRQLERKVEQTSRQVDRLKKDLDAAEKLPDDSTKEKKAKTKAIDKAKKDLEKAKSENEVAVKARDKPIQEALQRRIDKCQKLLDEAEKMPETNDQEKQMKLHRIEQCKPVWKSYPEKSCVDLREPPRHRADAAAGTTSRRWRGIATPLRRGSIRKHVSSMACGARNLTSTRLWCWASLGWERVSVPVTPVPVNTQEQRAIAALCS